MSNRKYKRILNELKELENSKSLFEKDGIYYHYNDDKVDIIYIMIIGPKNTPYENGFYFFELEYPDNYPMVPPKMKYHTQGTLPFCKPYKDYPNTHMFHTRFNPNLYVDGKVCLSMLNTWSGPGWVPTNTIINILVAIQALVLNEEPLRNEPGFETACDKDIYSYNLVIKYANIKIAILDQLKSNDLYIFECFREKMKELFIKNIDIIIQKIEEFQNIDKDIIASPAYNMVFKIDYLNLINYFKIIHTKILL